MRLEFYKDYDALHKIIDHLDKSHPHDLTMTEAIKLCLKYFPQWAIVEMVQTPYSGTDWEESSLFCSLLKTEAAKLYPSNKAFS